MKTILFGACFVLFGLSIPATATSLPDPIAPAAAGRIECFEPDTVRKTCSSLSSYEMQADGRILSTGLVVVSKEPFVTMEVSAPVEIKDGQVCGTVLKSQVTTAKFATRDRPLSTLQTELMRQQIAITFERFFGHEFCTGYVTRDGKLIAEAFMDGGRQQMKGPVIWVAKDEGYTVSP